MSKVRAHHIPAYRRRRSYGYVALPLVLSRNSNYLSGRGASTTAKPFGLPVFKTLDSLSVTPYYYSVARRKATSGVAPVATASLKTSPSHKGLAFSYKSFAKALICARRHRRREVLIASGFRSGGRPSFNNNSNVRC